MTRPTESGEPREAQIVETFLELADTLVADFDIIDALTVLASRCVEILDADATGILLADSNEQLNLVAASSEQARLVELFQLQSEEGPCLAAYATGSQVVHRSQDTSSGRWPRFAEYALGSGYESVYAIPLRLRDDVVGALNLFRTQREQLADIDVDLAQAFADLATITILHASAASEAQRRDEQLQHALDSRIIIEQAKGMLAEHAHIDMASAFDLIRSMSRNNNVKLTQIAQRIVDGQIDLAVLAAQPVRRK